MRFQIDIVGGEGLVYQYFSDPIERKNYSSNSWIPFYKTNEIVLYDLISQNYYIDIITHYDDGEIDSQRIMTCDFNATLENIEKQKNKAESTQKF